MSRPSFHATCRSALLSEGGDGHAGSEAFDEFDQLYTSNHFNQLKHLVSMKDVKDEDLPAKLQTEFDVPELEAKEITSFYTMHRKQVTQRVSDKSTIKEDRRGYGGWLSPVGKEVPVISAQAHENVAQNVLGDSWEELQGQGDDASGILGKRGWARLVHQPHQTLVDMDTNSRLTHRQLSYLKDLGIENDVDVFLDVGMTGRYLYRSGE